MNQAPAGRVVVLSGPTAVGKDTVIQALRRLHPELDLSVSATTRPPRPGEIDGVHYFFVSAAEFDELIADDGLLEWAWVHGQHRYGTPKEPVERLTAAGRVVLLQIDLQGARQIRRAMPQAEFVFLAPPSWPELVHRLVGRGTEDAAEQQRRLRTAREEMAAQSEFDHTIVNHDVAQATQELVGYLRL